MTQDKTMTAQPANIKSIYSPEYGQEISIPTGNVGVDMRFPDSATEPKGVSYVRFVNTSGEELVYWDSEEWREDPTAAMGAILGVFVGGPLTWQRTASTPVG